MMNKLISALGMWAMLGLFGGQLLAQEIAGTWQGTLSGSVTERVVLALSKTETGVLSAEIYGVDHAQSYLVGSPTYQAGVLKFTVPEFGSSYEGELSPDGESITGTWKWSAGGNGIAMRFEQTTQETSWAIDRTPHKVSFVTVEPGVKLEVLDWGGAGRPLVLLTGLGDNAHVFDTFAPKLTAKYHVYGITRRGFGASDAPQAVWENYSADRLGDDVIEVLDQLKLTRPVLAGHSIAGEELSSIGSRHPERVAGLIYMEPDEAAMYIPSQVSAAIDWNDMRKKVDAVTNAHTPKEQTALIQEMLETDLPQYQEELKGRQKYWHGLPDEVPPSEEKINSRTFKVSQAIRDGEERYTQIKCPVLAFFNQPDPVVLKTDADARTRVQAARAKFVESQEKAFEELGPDAHVVRISGANHFIFRSNEADVLREMNAFIAPLP
jgi:pimeloyl-ACP methyl ester carboxylesterase